MRSDFYKTYGRILNWFSHVSNKCVCLLFLISFSTWKVIVFDRSGLMFWWSFLIAPLLQEMIQKCWRKGKRRFVSNSYEQVCGKRWQNFIKGLNKIQIFVIRIALQKFYSYTLSMSLNSSTNSHPSLLCQIAFFFCVSEFKKI